MSTAAARRAYRGPAVFSLGLRPFYLLGSAWAAIAVALWLSSYFGGPAGLTLDWHVHEMIFGVLAAIIAGFLTTAIPNWTMRMPVIGAPLAGLVGLWCAGRIAMLLPRAWEPLPAIVDSAFLVVFAAVIWREILAGRNWRNAPVCALVSALAAGNILSHLSGGPLIASPGARIALGAVAVLIALIGGRITPSFTTNWLRARRAASLPAPFGLFDRITLTLTAVAAGAWALAPDHPVSGALLASAGLFNLARVARWAGWLTLGEPLVWILHLGYGWLGVGLILLGATRLTPLIAPSAGVHALTVGAVGVMTLAVMTRSARGHTGRSLAADRATMAIYAAINAAAVTRVAAPFSGAAQPALLLLSSVFWILAFGGFAAVHAVMLTTARPATIRGVA